MGKSGFEVERETANLLPDAPIYPTTCSPAATRLGWQRAGNGTGAKCLRPYEMVCRGESLIIIGHYRHHARPQS